MSKTLPPRPLPELATAGPLTFVDADGFRITFHRPVLSEIAQDGDRHEAVLLLTRDANGVLYSIRRPESTPIHDALRKERNL